MPKEPLFIGMLEKVWNKENSHKQEKIWLHYRKIMNKLESKQLKDKENKDKDNDLYRYLI
jgi:hypothetical protein